MKAPDGTWEGISIELWRRVAREHDLRYRFAEESNVQDLLGGFAAGKYDIVVAAMTPTAAREQTVDFAQPFYASGLGIAVPVAGLAGWLPVVRAMTSFGFPQAVMVLVGLAIVAGFMIWLFTAGITSALTTRQLRGDATHGEWWGHMPFQYFGVKS
jgi:polar amino acid transport system substrate-binding protein